ncbi:MAG: hypothetical protein DRH21_07485, partial [Deltaproteobacteria bacterium]
SGALERFVTTEVKGAHPVVEFTEKPGNHGCAFKTLLLTPGSIKVIITMLTTMYHMLWFFSNIKGIYKRNLT